MESNFQKWVNLSYLAVSFLLGYILYSIGLKVVGTYDLEARIQHVNQIVWGGSVIISLIMFIVLYNHEDANQFMNEVIVELSRVTWPTNKETTSATFVVIIMVIVSGLILGFLDNVWTTMLKWIL